MTSPGGNVVEIVVRVKDQTGPPLEEVKKKTTEVGGAFKRMGEIAGGVLLAQGVQAGARRAIALMQSTVNAAKDLGESVNAVGKIFDEATPKVIAWGKENANAFGLSQRAFNQAATPLGAMLKNTGMSMDEVAENTINLTKRAADVASVFNTEVTDALFAFQAALRGETEPIRRYGVSLSEVTIQAKALAMSGKQNAAELTAQEKAAARLALIFEQTADSAGDFGDTSDDLANAQRIATARIEDAKAKIGTAYLPVMAAAAQATGKLAEIFGGLPQKVQFVIAVVAALGAAAVIVIPRILAMKTALDAAAAAGSRAAAGLTLAATAAARIAPWLLLLGIQEKHDKVLFKVGEQAATTADAEKLLNEAIGEQQNKVSTLLADWEKLHGEMMSTDEAMLVAKESIEGLGDTFEENKFKVQGNSTAALENRVALEKAAKAAAEAADAYLEQTGDAEGAAKMMSEFRRAAEKSIGATGTAAKRVHDLAVELFKLPPVKEIKVNVKITGTGQLGRALRDVERLSAGGFAHGGISGAAGGGPRGNMTWVGEQGPELVRLPYGSTVIPSGQSMAMAQQQMAGGGVDVARPLVVNGGGFGQMAFDWLVNEVRRRGGQLAVLGLKAP